MNRRTPWKLLAGACVAAACVAAIAFPAAGESVEPDELNQPSDNATVQDEPTEPPIGISDSEADPPTLGGAWAAPYERAVPFIADHPNVFAGSIVSDNNQQITIFVADVNAPEVATLRSYFAPYGDDLLLLEEVPYSESELLQAQRVLTDPTSLLLDAARPVATVPDVRAGTLSILFDSADVEMTASGGFVIKTGDRKGETLDMARLSQLAGVPLDASVASQISGRNDAIHVPAIVE
ncbi:MAG: hypothetical protein Q4P15_12810 [Propionibacteriaceae bacterium]|nr:hypothetical protein [Propionibacteriaceae bacterium]